MILALYVALGIVAALLVTLVLYRNKTYHGFMMRQSNTEEDEYDRIYIKGQLE